MRKRRRSARRPLVIVVSDDGGLGQDGGRAGDGKQVAHKYSLEVELTGCADGSDVEYEKKKRHG